MRRVLFSLNILLGIALLLIIGFSLVSCGGERARSQPVSLSAVARHSCGDDIGWASISASARRPSGAHNRSSANRSKP